MITNQKLRKHKNFVYLIEKKIKGKWGLEWDCGCFLSYEVAEMSMKEFEKYTKNPNNYRIIMYISEKPYNE